MVDHGVVSWMQEDINITELLHKNEIKILFYHAMFFFNTKRS